MDVWIIRLSDRHAPDGSWRYGDRQLVPLEVARVAVDAGRARLADLESLPDPVPAVETADLSSGEPPAAEAATSRKPRTRGL